MAAAFRYLAAEAVEEELLETTNSQPKPEIWGKNRKTKKNYSKPISRYKPIKVMSYSQGPDMLGARNPCFPEASSWRIGL